MLNGLERFFIEKIRINTQLSFLLDFTQGQIIAIILFFTGLIGFIYLILKNKNDTKKTIQTV